MVWKFLQVLSSFFSNIPYFLDYILGELIISKEVMSRAWESQISILRPTKYNVCDFWPPKKSYLTHVGVDPMLCFKSSHNTLHTVHNRNNVTRRWRINTHGVSRRVSCYSVVFKPPSWYCISLPQCFPVLTSIWYYWRSDCSTSSLSHIVLDFCGWVFLFKLYWLMVYRLLSYSVLPLFN